MNIKVEAFAPQRTKNTRNCFRNKSVVENTFFHGSVHTFFFPSSYRLSASGPEKDLGSRSLFRAPKPQKTAIKYDKLGCHTWGCSWALPGCFWASPGLLGLSEGSRTAPSCLWAAPVASLVEPRRIIKTTLFMTTWTIELKPQRIFWDSGRV